MRARSDTQRTVLTGDDVAEAVERASQARRRIAQAVTYVPEADCLLVLGFPLGVFIERRRIPELRDVPREDLAELKLSPAGTTLMLERYNIHIELLGLIAAAINVHRREGTAGTIAELLQRDVAPQL